MTINNTGREDVAAVEEARIGGPAAPQDPPPPPAAPQTLDIHQHAEAPPQPSETEPGGGASGGGGGPPHVDHIVMQPMEITAGGTGHHGLESVVATAEGGQQVVMMANGEQHVVISDDGQIINGHVLQVPEGEQFVITSTSAKIEPEDLSFSVARDGDLRVDDDGIRHNIDLVAGAQAIQASAATAVQNVLRSLNIDHSGAPTAVANSAAITAVSLTNGGAGLHVPSGSVVMSNIGSNHHQSVIVTNDSIAGLLRQNNGSDPSGGVSPHGSTGVIIDDPLDRPDSALEDIAESVNSYTPGNGTKRGRSQGSPPRVEIAKHSSPHGFHYTLEAPTAKWIRKDEDRCSYLNKGQFYGVTLEFRPGPTLPLNSAFDEVKSVVVLVFRDAKHAGDELNAWTFWHQRQPSSKQRIIDAETNNISDDNGFTRIEDLAYNAIEVYWNPLQKPAFISLAIQCLSTDFSLRKGVKGLPMHLQIDTYVKNPADGEYDLEHRGYCQVKVFCDKGAERKCRQEERRAAKKVATGGERVLSMYHQQLERSEFYSMVDLTREPVLFTPSASLSPVATFPGIPQGCTFPGPGQSILKANGDVTPDYKRRKMYPAPESRMVVYVRQENEEIYTPLHLVPPTVQGLARAIESKYNVSAAAIRYLFRRNCKGITAKLDDDLLKYYCNEDTFLMQVTAIELEGQEGQESLMYDITLCEH